ncbi:MAG: DinB family protein, partial [Chitinophagales bacterium]
TIQEIVCHIIDAERILCYRALCIARGEQQMLPGFEENDYVQASHANERNFEEMLHELETVRKSTIALVKSFTPEMINARGNANNHPITVNALCKVIAGHEMHHLAIIREKYLAH